MEHEVQGHTKKIYKAWKDPRKQFWDKVKDIGIEIGIIVFAISLSIWFHSWSEHRHDQKDVKGFLIGLKGDLEADIKEMNEDIKSYVEAGQTFNYVASLKMNELPAEDSIKKYERSFNNSTGLIANAGRFEGFKSSGKIGNIGNRQLQNDILDLYEEDIPHLIGNTDLYTNNKLAFFSFIKKNTKRVTDSTTNFKEIISSGESFAYARALSHTEGIIEIYDMVIAKNKKIIEAINKEYDLK